LTNTCLMNTSANALETDISTSTSTMTSNVTTDTLITSSTDGEDCGK
jgi:hypothetical protein